MTSACVSAFITNISVAMDTFFSMKIIKSHPSDKPWMTASLKNLIMLINLWYHYIDKVRLEITDRKRIFMQKKSDTDPGGTRKAISGQSNNIAPIYIEKNGVTLTDVQLVNALNEFYIAVNVDIPPLDMHELSDIFSSRWAETSDILLFVLLHQHRKIMIIFIRFVKNCKNSTLIKQCVLLKFQHVFGNNFLTN